MLDIFPAPTNFYLFRLGQVLITDMLEIFIMLLLITMSENLTYIMSAISSVYTSGDKTV